MKKLDYTKIIYFDEQSALDLIYMANQGEIISEMISIDGKKKDDNKHIDAGVGGSLKILNFLKAKIVGEYSFNISSESNEIINKIIHNTTITDYLKVVNGNEIVTKFEDYKVYPYPKSVTSIKLFTPYLSMTEGGVNAGDIEIKSNRIDSALEKAKGYYELIGIKEHDANRDKVILRFNLRSFRNSYTLQDLMYMELIFHGIKVGKMKESDLDANKMYGEESDFENKQRLVSEALENKSEVRSDDELIVYDILFAGIRVVKNED